MRRWLAATVVASAAAVLGAGPAAACGGLIGPRGGVNLVKTTTLAGYHDGIEHYVTAFKFLGAGGQFGSIVPLPGVPTKVERGGDWTLQRLVREVQPPVAELADNAVGRVAATSASAQVILTAKVGALDLTVLSGGGTAVGDWAREHGFVLPPDAPEVLDFYATRSPIFMAAVFDGNAAKATGQQLGDGTPIHLTIPTSQPWVPLRILGLGRQAQERIQADVFLLTDRQPSLLPLDGNPGLSLERSESASGSLLADLHNDKSMDWVPTSSMWLSYLKVDSPAGSLTYDLAIDAHGGARPSPWAAGFGADQVALGGGVPGPATPAKDRGWTAALVVLAVIGAGGGLAGLAVATRKR
ncbi:MAG: hypothetical protein JWO37_2919 [Acidimicrobiales bacterium]|jgi:hypothetical protein|nr:hypothetical protein [Acidimicrobiales bacterium]